MSVKITEQLVDDLDGSEASTTVSFALEGTAYEIDLNDKNAQAFRKSMQKYVDAARRARPGTARSGRASKPGRRGKGLAGTLGYDLEDIRAWAQGRDDVRVAERGRIANSVIEQYHAEQQGKNGNGAKPRKVAAKKAATAAKKTAAKKVTAKVDV